MSRLLLLIAVVAAIIWFLRWFRVTPPERAARTLRKALLWGFLGFLLLAALTGRLNPLFAALGAAVPVVLRLANLLRLVPALQQILRSLGLDAGPAGAEPSASRIRTRYLAMRLNHATGTLDGTVLEGPFKDRELASLGLDDLLRMLEFYRGSDAQSAAVLEAYLDREREPGWRERASASGGAPPPSSDGTLSEAEARSILGVATDADAAAIRAAHRRLMQRLHPDRGGSDYLAAKINAAKQRLLGD